jgi:hypothetical protein
MNQKQNPELKMASHILQFIYLGEDGFRFPFAFYPTNGVNAPDLFILFWQCLQMLNNWEFNVDYVCMDGAVCNRSFMSICSATRAVSLLKVCLTHLMKLLS